MIRRALAWFDRFPRHVLRLAVALGIGIVAGAAVYSATSPIPPGGNSSDFQAQWFSARAFWDGRPAYEAIGPEPWRAMWWPMRSGYPATAFVVLGPLARLPLHAAEGILAGLGAAALAWVVTRRSWAPLVVFASWPFLFALRSVQWSPLMTLAAVPAFAWLAATKPTIGAAVAAYGIGRRWLVSATLGGLALAGIAWLVDPGWLGAWWEAAHAPAHHTIGVPGSASLAYVPMVTLPGGFIALLALLRWRRPEARLVAAFACVPHTLSGYELVLLLALVPATLGESVALVLLTWSVRAIVDFQGPYLHLMDAFVAVGQWSVALVVVPCTLIVLRRPNEGNVPECIERIATRSALRMLRSRNA